MIDSFSGEYRFLSNFWSVNISYQGITYPSTEHAYQAAKSPHFLERIRIATLPTGEAKREGQKLELRADWDNVKIQVMRELLMIKFANPDLQAKLLATESHELVEGNWWGDIFWGVCNGVGQNHLGRLLMEVREHYRRKI
jgi:ribA/ribD-fused uncharacterized protein